MGFPNVRIAEKAEETEALEARYFQALMDGDGRGALAKIEEFEADVATSSRAVVAMDVDAMRNLAVNASELYSNYQLAVRAQRRSPAALPNDQRRMAVDGKLWGGFGENIRYAALSLDRCGLSSYGDCFATLRNLNIELRASVLEENSFEFAEASPSQPLPLGYRSNWEKRHLVAVAKCAGRITSTTPSADFPIILLENASSRRLDEFIEVHIYGPFDFSAIEAIGTSGRVTDKRGLLTLDIIEQKAIAEGKAWLS